MKLEEVEQKTFEDATSPLWQKQIYPENVSAEKEEFYYLAYDEEHNLLGGISGEFRWSWCYVSKLVIDPKYQGKKYGTFLLEYIEKIAKTKKQIGVKLKTFSYQAPKFYEQLGFKEYGRLEDCPPGHAQILYYKTLK